MSFSQTPNIVKSVGYLLYRYTRRYPRYCMLFSFSAPSPSLSLTLQESLRMSGRVIENFVLFESDSSLISIYLFSLLKNLGLNGN